MRVLAGALLCSGLAIAALAHPGSAIAVDRAGVVYFVDTGSGVYKLDARGTITRIPGPAFHWFAVDAANRFAETRLPADANSEFKRAGADPSLILSSDYPVATGADGNLYYALPASGGGIQLVRFEPSGKSSVFTRLPAQANGKPLLWLNGLTTAPDGSFYYTEGAAVHRVTTEGRVSTVVAAVAPPKCAAVPMDGESPPMLRGLDVDSAGNVYVAAAGCGSVLKITAKAEISVLLQVKPPWSPTAVALYGSDLYVLEYLHTKGDDRREWKPRIRKLSPDGTSAIVGRIDR